MKKLLVFAVCVVVSGKAFAQKCATDEMMRIERENHPETELLRKQIEEHVTRFVENEKRRAEKTTDELPRSRFIIPCVVHVVHRNVDNPVEKLSFARVQSQFDALFNDFRRVPGTRGWGAGVDTEIEFQLATIDPWGQPTNGVDYVVSDAWADLERNLEDEPMKLASYWDKDRYFNIWTVRQIDDGSILGYAFKPESGYDRDGIVVKYNCFGTLSAGGQFLPGNNLGRTTTHEIGHWLSLDHPFHDHTGGTNGCHQGFCTQTGDKICDTPPAAAPSYGVFSARKNSCVFDVPDLPDNPRLYMDYLNDAGLNLFSPQQAAQMRAVLQMTNLGRRYQLWQKYVHEETGVGSYKAPKANFWASNLRPCPGSPVQFLDYSQNRPTEYLWRFPGGVPETSTDAAPVVAYPAPGNYSVELVVRNLSGVSDSIRKSGFIRVIDTVPLPLNQNFNGAYDPVYFPTGGWYVFNPDSITTEISRRWDGVGHGHLSPGGCARMRFHTYSDYNQEDGLVAPGVSLAGADSGAVFKFSYAYAPYQSQSPNLLFTDTLSVQMSLDCGHSWTTLWRRGGNQLMTAAGPKMSEWFEPTANDWRRDSVSIDSLTLKGSQTVRFRFWAKNGWGNNLFIDDVFFNAYRRKPYVADTLPDTTRRTLLLSEALIDLSVYPNPSRKPTVRVVTRKTTEATLEVYNATGRRIYSRVVPLRFGETDFGLPTDDWACGVYAVRLAGTSLSTRWVKNE